MKAHLGRLWAQLWVTWRASGIRADGRRVVEDSSLFRIRPFARRAARRCLLRRHGSGLLHATVRRVSGPAIHSSRRTALDLSDRDMARAMRGKVS